MSTRTQGNYYTPQPVRMVPGLELLENRRAEISPWPSFIDTYRGTAHAFVDSGLCTPDMLPPDAGCSRTWRPVGATRPWMNCPGYLMIYRLPDGRFRAAVTVSREEQESRAAAAEARRQQQEAEGRAQKARERLAKLTAIGADQFMTLMADQLRRALVHIGSQSERFLEGEPVYPFLISAEAFEDLARVVMPAVEAFEAAAPVRVSPLLLARSDKGFRDFLDAQCISTSASAASQGVGK